MILASRQPICVRAARDGSLLVCAANVKLPLVIQKEPIKKRFPNYWPVESNHNDEIDLTYGSRAMGRQSFIWPFVSVLGSEMRSFSSTENST